MSWDAVFAEHDEEWSAPMTADVAFHTPLAVQASGPLVELALGIQGSSRVPPAALIDP